MPEDILERLIHKALHEAAREIGERVADQFESGAWYSAFGLAAKDILSGVLSQSLLRGADQSVRVGVARRCCDVTDILEAIVEFPSVSMNFPVENFTHLDRLDAQKRTRPMLKDGKPMYRLKNAPLSEYSLVDRNASPDDAVEYEVI